LKERKKKKSSLHGSQTRKRTWQRQIKGKRRGGKRFVLILRWHYKFALPVPTNIINQNRLKYEGDMNQHY
jgi:hypothetical protein